MRRQGEEENIQVKAEKDGWHWASLPSTSGLQVGGVGVPRHHWEVTGGTVQGLNEVYKVCGRVQAGQHCEEGGLGDGVKSLIEINVEAVATD